jgi:thioesterase domain-containing protein
MGARVVRATGAEVVLAAPLPPNLNHRDTAFGGSVAALAILAGWTLVDLRLHDAGIHARTVIQSSRVDYVEPVEDVFEARATPPREPAWRRLFVGLERWGRGRIRLGVEVRSGGLTAATMEGAYVALMEEV